MAGGGASPTGRGVCQTGPMNRFVTSAMRAQPLEERLRLLRRMLLDALADDTLTPQELHELRAARAELGLTPAQARELRAEVYSAALARAQADDRISVREADLLDGIIQFFNVHQDD